MKTLSFLQHSFQIVNFSVLLFALGLFLRSGIKRDFFKFLRFKRLVD